VSPVARRCRASASACAHGHTATAWARELARAPLAVQVLQDGERLHGHARDVLLRQRLVRRPVPHVPQAGPQQLHHLQVGKGTGSGYMQTLKYHHHLRGRVARGRSRPAAAAGEQAAERRAPSPPTPPPTQQAGPSAAPVLRTQGHAGRTAVALGGARRSPTLGAAECGERGGGRAARGARRTMM